MSANAPSSSAAASSSTSGAPRPATAAAGAMPPPSTTTTTTTTTSTVRSYTQPQSHPNHASQPGYPPPPGPGASAAGTSQPGHGHAGSSSAGAGASSSTNVKKRSWSSNYYEYNLAEMTDSRGGFLTPNSTAAASSSSANHEDLPSDPKRARTHYPSLDPDSTLDKCAECKTSTDLDPRYQDHFHLNVCWSCKDKVPDKYALLTKTEARQDYLLTDDELKDDILFPHVWRKKNPRKQTFHDMYLYLRMHVEAYAVTKWGSLEKMDEEFERREKDRERRKEEKFKKNLERLRKATRTSLWSKGNGNGIGEAAGEEGMAAAAHVHEFVEGEEEGTLACACGMVVEGEVM